MGYVKNFRYLLVIFRTGNDDKSINKIANIDEDHKRQEGNGFVQFCKGKLYGVEQGKSVRQYIR